MEIRERQGLSDNRGFQDWVVRVVSAFPQDSREHLDYLDPWEISVRRGKRVPLAKLGFQVGEAMLRPRQPLSVRRTRWPLPKQLAEPVADPTPVALLMPSQLRHAVVVQQQLIP